MMQLGDEWEHPIFGPVVVRNLTPRQDGRVRVTSISRDGKSAAHTAIKPGEELGPILRRYVPTEREIIEALVAELEEHKPTCPAMDAARSYLDGVSSK